MKEEEYYIFANIDKNATLFDKRGTNKGLVFGNVKDICRQYGIVMKKENGMLKFSGPKNRLRLFAEKLHFSGHEYFV